MISPTLSITPLALLALLLQGTAIGQSAASFGSVPEKSALGSPQPAVQDIASMPSRSIDPTDVAAYVANMISTFSMQSRALDAFGHSQDPNAKPIVKEPTMAVRRSSVRQETPFANIVQLLNVTTVMPGEKSFLVGTRSFKTGELVPLVYRGRALRVRVKDVSSRRICFENLDNGETAQRDLNLLPPGMSPGNNSGIAPGMAPDLANAPIELAAP